MVARVPFRHNVRCIHFIPSHDQYKLLTHQETQSRLRLVHASADLLMSIFQSNIFTMTVK
jgi:hypothetical protein